MYIVSHTIISTNHCRYHTQSHSNIPLLIVPLSKDNDLRPDMDYGPVHNHHSCGASTARSSRQVAQRRIVGGDEAGFGSFPWQAYIRIGKRGYIFLPFHVINVDPLIFSRCKQWYLILLFKGIDNIDLSFF